MQVSLLQLSNQQELHFFKISVHVSILLAANSRRGQKPWSTQCLPRHDNTAQCHTHPTVVSLVNAALRRSARLPRWVPDSAWQVSTRRVLFAGVLLLTNLALTSYSDKLRGSRDPVPHSPRLRVAPGKQRVNESRSSQVSGRRLRQVPLGRTGRKAKPCPHCWCCTGLILVLPSPAWERLNSHITHTQATQPTCRLMSSICTLPHGCHIAWQNA